MDDESTWFVGGVSCSQELVVVLPVCLSLNDIEFFWLAQNDSRVSLITVGSDKSHLQVLIHEAGKNRVFHGTDARDLVIWMVSTFEKGRDRKYGCASRCGIIFKPVTGWVRLDEGSQLANP
jgi:hypothetical protein